MSKPSQMRNFGQMVSQQLLHTVRHELGTIKVYEQIGTLKACYIVSVYDNTDALADREVIVTRAKDRSGAKVKAFARAWEFAAEMEREWTRDASVNPTRKAVGA